VAPQNTISPQREREREKETSHLTYRRKQLQGPTLTISEIKATPLKYNANVVRELNY
jgi:hypothetical protein